MEIAIIGLPLSGKTTLFNALTKRSSGFTKSGFDVKEPTLGVAKVPDHRVDTLAQIFRPKKITPVEIVYRDIPGMEGVTEKGISSRHLNVLQQCDALIITIRAFTDPYVPQGTGGIDVERDVAQISEELILSDLGIIERSINRKTSLLKSSKSHERDIITREIDRLSSVKDVLESGKPLKDMDLSDEDIKILSVYQLLTAKPLIIVFNLGEADLTGEFSKYENIVGDYHASSVGIVYLCGKLEEELSALSREDEEQFRDSLGVKSVGVSHITRLIFDLMNLVSFLTVGSDEVKAWSIPRDTFAVNGAGKIHSDLERGFIRAEVISYDDFMECGSMMEGRKKGLLRSEGKTYLIQDGDLINILFNV